MSLIAVFDGAIGGSKTVFKASDDSISVVVLDAEGLPQDLTGDAINLEIHSSKIRGTATATIAGSLTAPTAGHGTFTLADTDLTFGPGTFYAFLQYIASGGEIAYGSEYLTLSVK